MNDTGSKSTRLLTVALCGLPNAGKSTLLNALIGQKIAPVHRKPQMTRKNLVGLRTDGELQLVFLDTPGIHQDQQLLNQSMKLEWERAFVDADAVVLIHSVTESWKNFPMAQKEQLLSLSEHKPVIIVLNQKDQPESEWETSVEKTEAAWIGKMPVVFLSGKTQENLDSLIKILDKFSYPSEHVYDGEDLTPHSCRELVSEIILEKLMEYLHEEIPYQISVVIEDYRESAARHDIYATLIVNRDSQKPMVIGKGGSTLKKIGAAARAEIKDLVGTNVFLELRVKVDPNWIKSQQKISDYCGISSKKRKK